MSKGKADLQDIISQKVRLGILSILAVSGKESFGDLLGQLDVTDGNLSSHLKMLSKHSLIKIKKSFENNRPKTDVEITGKGHREFEKYLDSMEDLLKRHRTDE